ncbi:histidine kinase, partial [Pseudoalteromonas sp. S1691]
MQSTAHQDAVYELEQLWDELAVVLELSSLFPHRRVNLPLNKCLAFSSAIAASLFASLMVCSYLLINLENCYNE